MLNIHYRSALFLVFVACALAGAPAAATTLVPAEFGQMARESELIVRGTVVAVQAHVVGPRRTRGALVGTRRPKAPACCWRPATARA